MPKSTQDSQRPASATSSSFSAAEDVIHRATDAFDSFTTQLEESVNEYYEEASQWLGANYGKTLVAAGMVALIGWVGYSFLQKSDRESIS